jgi:hypothetical protein
MGLLLILAGVSSWVGGRFNWVSNFCARVVWLAVKGTEMLTILVYERAGCLVCGGAGFFDFSSSQGRFHLLEVLLYGCSLLLLCIKVPLLLTEIYCKFLRGNRLGQSHSWFSCPIGAMDLFPQAELDAFLIVVFPFHLFC